MRSNRLAAALSASTAALALTASVLGFAAAPAGGGGASTAFLGADLDGANEVPPTASSATGFAGIYVDSFAGILCSALDITGIDDLSISAAHIHEGGSGALGPPVVTLPISSHHSSHGLTGCVLVEGPLAASIISNPAGYYVNIHTAAAPDGEIRGQLAPAEDDTTDFSLDLLGTNERPVTDPDLEARAEIGVSPDGLICADFDYGNLGPVAADHLHMGSADEAGPMVVDLGHAWWGGNGCVVMVRTKAALALAEPENHYVRVHTITWPDGAVRAQLLDEDVATTTTTTTTGPSGDDDVVPKVTTTVSPAPAAQPVAAIPTFTG